jgi:hypothetical protein
MSTRLEQAQRDYEDGKISHTHHQMIVLKERNKEILGLQARLRAADKRIRELEAMQPEAARREFEVEPFAWAIKLASGVESLVYHPIEGALELRDGDVAYPLFRELYTREQLEISAAEAKELVSGLNLDSSPMNKEPQ